jgi:glycosyltransferase involved in cell wall biosynthesis
MMTKVLFVVHNHPSVYPGGAETYAYELYSAMRDSEDFEPLLVARIGPMPGMPRHGHSGTPFSAVTPNDPNQFFLYTRWDDYSFFRLTLDSKRTYATHLTEFLQIHEPDVVHFQHTQFIGLDAVSHTRRVLPDAPIIYTLHEFLPICHRNGHMLRTNGELCTEASPRRCNECFPDIPPQNFFLRERFVKSHLEHVDMFLAPSRFLLERYVAWGIPRERIRFEDCGRLAQERVIGRQDPDTPRNRLGFFGQIDDHKGVRTLLAAMILLNEQGVNVHLSLHGANLGFQTPEFQEDIKELVEWTSGKVTLQGSYHQVDLPRLMAEVDWVVVPSEWWENSPLVIKEAFMHGRPVICSDIGAMAEKVTDGVDGLHFRVSDPASLADTIKRAVTTPGLWHDLHARLPDVYSMEDHISSLAELYAELREHRTARKGGVAS